MVAAVQLEAAIPEFKLLLQPHPLLLSPALVALLEPKQKKFKTLLIGSNTIAREF